MADFFQGSLLNLVGWEHVRPGSGCNLAPPCWKFHLKFPDQLPRGEWDRILKKTLRAGTPGREPRGGTGLSEAVGATLFFSFVVPTGLSWPPEV